MNHSAIIAALEDVRPHPNADRLMLANVLGYQIIVGLENHTGEMGLFFYPELALTEEYLIANDLIRRKDPITGENKGGMFDKNGRVRQQKFRSEKSEGYWAPISSIGFTKYPGGFVLGETFQEINGIKICDKYITRATQNAMSSSKQFKRQNK